MLSIDQNSHSLWDVLPKLHALASKGVAATHYVEDIDVAFTAMGAELASAPLQLVRERYHHSGGADWGAAMFYTEFLGRQPVEVRDLEPFVGTKLSALAKKLGRGVDDLYDEFSPGDNWQLIGPSFVGGRDHHRVVGDLTVAETAPLLRELLSKARENTLESFPASACRRRANDWFDREEALVERLVRELAAGKLVDLYARWLGEHLGGAVRLGLTSELFACSRADAPGLRLVAPFVRDYPAAARLYNEAVAESGVSLHPLDTRAGELPLFATFAREGHLVRAGASFRNGMVEVPGLPPVRPGDDGSLPPENLAAAGVRCVAGKAALLVTQVRCGPGGEELALPHRGSGYMPAAHGLVRKLTVAGMLDGPPKPVVRVRLCLLDRIAAVDAPVRLPAYLAEAFGEAEVPCRKLAESWREIAGAAAARLESFRDDEARRRWQESEMPDAHEELTRLDARKRDLAKLNPKAPELREIWKHMRELQTGVLERTLRRIDADVQLAGLEYYDTRGAAMPWCVALGGERFYQEVIRKAELKEEGCHSAPRRSSSGRQDGREQAAPGSSEREKSEPAP